MKLFSMSNIQKAFLPAFLAVSMLFIPSTCTAFQQDKDEKKHDHEHLEIGSKAPKLNIEHWLSDGKGKFKKVTSFEDGKVYVVEFWATWCGPCIASMPHLAELQKKLADKKVQIISISDEDLETVEEFLEKEVRGKDDQTYADLTSAYCLTTDPDKSVYKDYMEAAHQNGIPTAFVVGKKGHIEWIGHPMEMDKVLDKVVAGKWDREQYKKQMVVDAKIGKLFGKAMGLAQREEFDKALKVLDEIKGMKSESQMMKFVPVARAEIVFRKGGEGAEKAFDTLLEFAKDNPMQVNQFTWSVVEQEQAKKGSFSKGILAKAEKATKKAAELAKDEQMKGAILDTYAHLLYLNGKLDEAIKAQKEALEYSSEEGMEEFLEKLESEAEKKK